MPNVNIGTRPHPADERVVVELRDHVRARAAGRSASIDVLIADGSCVVRAGLRTLLEADADIAVAAEAATGEQAVALACETEPDVVLMDIHLPTVGAVEATRRIRSDRPYVKVLILATVAHDEEICNCLEAGASGLLIKDVEPPELLHAINVVARGGTQLSASLMSRVIDQLYFSRKRTRRDGGEPDQPVPDAFQELTAREREIVALAALGLTNRQIADRLMISTATVKTHVSRAMRKIGIHHRAALVAMAYQAGLVDATETQAGDGANESPRSRSSARPASEILRMPRAAERA
jgi:DNA-binding NarL/FixJ family response regulator